MLNSRSFPIWLAAFASVAIIPLALLADSDPAMQAQLAARWTARVGFPLFILTYCASSLARLWPGPAWSLLLRRRRQWGLAFALAHTVHLAALVNFFLVSGQTPATVSLVGGGFAYLMLYLMVLTSNDRAMRWLGPRWKLLHRTGIHVIWFVYTFSYFGRLFDPGLFLQGAILFPVCLGAAGLRIAAWWQGRRRRAGALA